MNCTKMAFYRENRDMYRRIPQSWYSTVEGFFFPFIYSNLKLHFIKFRKHIKLTAGERLMRMVE